MSGLKPSPPKAKGIELTDGTLGGPAISAKLSRGKCVLFIVGDGTRSLPTSLLYPFGKEELCEEIEEEPPAAC